jgi:hypothetical protein
MAVEVWAPCGDCNNNNKVILIKIIIDGNLTLTKRSIKIKYCTYIISVKFDTACSLQVEGILVCSWNAALNALSRCESVTQDRFFNQR